MKTPEEIANEAFYKYPRMWGLSFEDVEDMLKEASNLAYNECKEMVETSQILDSDDHGDALGPFYIVALKSDLWDELEEVLGVRGDRA